MFRQHEHNQFFPASSCVFSWIHFSCVARLLTFIIKCFNVSNVSIFKAQSFFLLFGKNMLKGRNEHCFFFFFFSFHVSFVFLQFFLCLFMFLFVVSHL